MTGATCLSQKTRDCWKKWMDWCEIPIKYTWTGKSGKTEWFHLISTTVMNGMVDLATCLSCAVCPRVLKVICMNARRNASNLALYQFLEVS